MAEESGNQRRDLSERPGEMAGPPRPRADPGVLQYRAAQTGDPHHKTMRWSRLALWTGIIAAFGLPNALIVLVIHGYFSSSTFLQLWGVLATVQGIAGYLLQRYARIEGFLMGMIVGTLIQSALCGLLNGIIRQL